MKNHHNDTPKSSEYFQPLLVDNIDQDIDEERQLKPVVRFNQVIQSMLHRFSDDVNRYKHATLSESLSSKLSLTIPQEDKPPLSVHIESTILANNETRRKISVQEWREDGTPAAFHRYHEEGDAVLRYDIEDMSKRMSLLSSSGSEISERVISERIEQTKNEIKNSELERQLGVNDQPVTIDEINKLAELLESAQVSRWN